MIIRFVLGAFVMIDALMFLGCPIRMLLRLAGGNLNGIVLWPGWYDERNSVKETVYGDS